MSPQNSTQIQENPIQSILKTNHPTPQDDAIPEPKKNKNVRFGSVCLEYQYQESPEETIYKKWKVNKRKICRHYKNKQIRAMQVREGNKTRNTLLQRAVKEDLELWKERNIEDAPPREQVSSSINDGNVDNQQNE